MKYDHTFKIIAVVSVIGMLMAMASLTVIADSNTEVKPLALRKIMQDMGKNMQGITDGISREDWELVEKMSLLIAEHPQPPPLEKISILSFIGTEVGKFKGYDEETHKAAQGLRQAAVTKNGSAVVFAYATLQNSCLACHLSFRKPFKEHFYEKR
jgi:cytochrome c556